MAKLKQEFKDKLIELGVYEKWQRNIEEQRGEEPIPSSLNEQESFLNFIDESFIWMDTPEGHDFWEEISLK